MTRNENPGQNNPARNKLYRKPVKQTNAWSRTNLPAVILILLALSSLGLVLRLSLSQASKGITTKTLGSTRTTSNRWGYIMTDLIGQTRHFKGLPDAPVTILEFSDFQ